MKTGDTENGINKIKLDNGITIYDSSDATHNTTIKSAASGGSLNLILPNSSGTSGQYLKTDGSGNLSWDTVSSGGGGGATDSITEGNTTVETVDTGSDGHIKFSTEGSERIRIDKDGKVGIGITNPSNQLVVNGGILGLNKGSVINSFAGAYRTNIIATKAGIKRFGDLEGRTGDSHNVNFGSSSYTGDDNLVISGTESLNIIQVVLAQRSSYNEFYLLCGDGTLKCWGINDNGALGIGNTTNQDEMITSNYTSVATSLGTKIIKVAAGKEFSLVLLKNGKVLSSGRNNYGQLGIGSTTNQSSPQTISIFDGTSDDKFVVDIACTNYNGYAVTKDGKLWSWGLAQQYDGDAGTIARSGSNTSPGKVTDGSNEITNVKRWSIDCKINENVLACASSSVLFLLQNGKLYGFGRNRSGALGIGNTNNIHYALRDKYIFSYTNN